MSTPSYSGNIQIPVPQSTGTYAQWQGMWNDELGHVDSLMSQGKAELALMYITTSMFGFLSSYTETYQMLSEANYMNALSTLDQLRNAQEEDFDAYQNSDNNNNYAYALDALNAQDKINEIINNPDYQNMLSSISGDVGNQENAICDGQTTTTDPTGSNLAAYWQSEWAVPSSSSTDTSSVQPTTNALTALSNDFSSQSSVAQSELKYYQSNDAQYQSIDHDVMQSIISQEQAMVTAMQGASN